MEITKHARHRINERVGIGKRSIDRQATLALERGYTYNKTKGNLKKYLNKLQFSYHTGGEMRVYNNHVFIFTKQFKLITVLPLPTHLQDSNLICKK